MHGAISWDLSKHGQKICPRLIRHLRAIFAQLRHTHYEKKIGERNYKSMMKFLIIHTLINKYGQIFSLDVYFSQMTQYACN